MVFEKFFLEEKVLSYLKKIRKLIFKKSKVFAYPKPITLIKCKWAKKTHNTPLFYIPCCVQLNYGLH